MNTKYFDSVLELAKTKNFSRAAANLYISQPSLTYQINAVEQEIGFRIFDRSGKGAVLTPAGEQFAGTLRDIQSQLNRAIEQGQNFSARYRDNIRIGMPVRSAIGALPEIMNLFQKDNPSVSITPQFDYYHYLDKFLAAETDILFSMKERVKHIPDLQMHDFYQSRLYLVCRRDDPLAEKKIIRREDLAGRTLMIGGGSPAGLRKLQQQIISDLSVSYFNSEDHDTSLTFVEASAAVVIAPGFLNDHHPRCAWIPFDSDIVFDCVLCTHNSDTRRPVEELVSLMIDYYRHNHIEV